MILFVQGLSAILGATAVFLLFGYDPDPPPIGVYIVAAIACGAGGSWLYVRWRYGKDAVIRGSRRID